MSDGNKPQVGDIVHFYPSEYWRDQISTLGGNTPDAGQPVAAIIVRVWNTNMVNLKVLTDAPADLWAPSIEYRARAKGDLARWCWPPRND